MQRKERHNLMLLKLDILPHNQTHQHFQTHQQFV